MSAASPTEGAYQEAEAAAAEALLLALPSFREAERRAKDKTHKAKFNNEAMADLVSAGLDDKAARAAVIAIARGAVRHTTITY